MSVRPLEMASVALGCVVALAGAGCQAEHAHIERRTLEPVQLQAGEPRVIRWQLCKEGLGTGEAINAELELGIERLDDASGQVEVRRWESVDAFEAGEAPLPFPAVDVTQTDDELRIDLRPEGPFTRDGRRCTQEQFVQLEGEAVIVEASIEARVLDWGQVIDRLTLEAEMLP
jgi:hypothetical protein